MNNPNHYQSQDNTESSQRLFERRVYCGVCGRMMIRTTLRRHSPERAFHCPACQKDVNSRNYHFRYPIYDLEWDVRKALRKERRTALRTRDKVTDARITGQVALVEQYYHQKMDSFINKLSTNTKDLNAIFLEKPIDEPFSVDTMKSYTDIQSTANTLTQKLANNAEILLTFYSSFTLENSWYQLFRQLPEDISLTTDLIKTTIDQIILTSGKPPEIKFYKQEDRSHLFWSLNLISKVKQRLERKEHLDDDE